MACPGRFDQPCPIPETCPYHLIFETSPPPGSDALRTHDDIPRPFVISPITDNGEWLKHGRRLITPGSELSFDLTLIGRAQEYFPYFVVAFREIDRLGRRHYAHAAKNLAQSGEDGASRRVRDLEAGNLSPGSGIKDSSAVRQDDSGTYSATSRNPNVTSPFVIPSEPSGSEATRACPEPAEGDRRDAIRLDSASPPTRAVELRRIDLLDPLTGAATPVYDATENLVRPLRKPLTLADCAAIPPPSSNRLTLHFQTQTRLKHEGGYARIPEFQIVFRRLLGRLSSLSRFHCGTPLDVDFKGLIDRAASIRLIQNDTEWTRWQRYSSRQDRRMEWVGIVGGAAYEGDLAPFWQLLRFGEFVHVGHGATFGLGKYAIRG
jgi:hypothetical protein